MNSLLLVILLIFIGQILGSLFGILKKPSTSFLHISLAFAASMMLSISFIQLIPESLKVTTLNSVIIALFSGAIIMGLIDKLLPHINPELSKKEKPSIKRSVTMLIIGMALHNLPEGLAIGIGFALTTKLGIVIALGIALQDLPENIATIVPLYGMNKKRLKSFLILMATVLFELIGFFIGFYFFKIASLNLLGIFLSFAAGVMIYISVEELIPAAEISKSPLLSGVSISLGILIVLATNFI
ncbi:MAG: ZIP family metal transporter [Candidatus Aminicenantia bacterium]